MGRECHKHFYQVKIRGTHLVRISKADFMYLCRETGCGYSTAVRSHAFDGDVRVEHFHTITEV